MTRLSHDERIMLLVRDMAALIKAHLWELVRIAETDLVLRLVADNAEDRTIDLRPTNVHFDFPLDSDGNTDFERFTLDDWERHDAAYEASLDDLCIRGVDVIPDPIEQAARRALADTLERLRDDMAHEPPNYKRTP